MNRQRKVLITTTYNEMGIIIDTKAEEVAQPDLQPTCNQLATDCISRQAAIDEFSCCELTPDGGIDVNYAIDFLEQLPSAQPERKTGRWIERNPQNSPDCRLIECSECGNAYIVGYNIDYDDWIDGRDFCMRCGADLRGGSNGKST